MLTSFLTALLQAILQSEGSTGLELEQLIRGNILFRKDTCMYPSHQLILIQNKWERTQRFLSDNAENFSIYLRNANQWLALMNELTHFTSNCSPERSREGQQKPLLMQTRNIGKNYSTKPLSRQYVHFCQKALEIQYHVICYYYVADHAGEAIRFF